MSFYMHRPLSLRSIFFSKPDTTPKFVLIKKSFFFFLPFAFLFGKKIRLPYTVIHGQRYKSFSYSLANYFLDESRESYFSVLINLFVQKDVHKDQLICKYKTYLYASLLDKVAFYEYALTHVETVLPLLTRREALLLKRIIDDTSTYQFFDSDSLKSLISFRSDVSKYHILYDAALSLIPNILFSLLLLVLICVRLFSLFYRLPNFLFSKSDEIVLSKWNTSMKPSTVLGKISSLGCLLPSTLPTSVCRIFEPTLSITANRPSNEYGDYQYNYLSPLNRLFALNYLPFKTFISLIRLNLYSLISLLRFRFAIDITIDSSLFDALYAYSSSVFISPRSLLITYNDNSLFDSLFNTFLIQKDVQVVSYSHTFQSYGMFIDGGHSHDWDRSYRVTNTHITGPMYLVNREWANSLLADKVISCDFIPSHYRNTSTLLPSSSGKTELKITVFLASYSSTSISNIESFISLFTALKNISIKHPFLTFSIKAKSKSHIANLAFQSPCIREFFDNLNMYSICLVPSDQPALSSICVSDINIGMPFSSPIIDGLSLSKPSFFVDLCNFWSNSFFSQFSDVCVTSTSSLEIRLVNAFKSSLLSEKDYVTNTRSLFRLSESQTLETVQSSMIRSFK